jgi:hypothetical protein
MEFGKAKYGKNKKNYYKIKDVPLTFGIFPPIGKDRNDPVVKEGIWAVYWDVVYGYTNPDGKSRAFKSSLVKNFKTKMVEVPDAAVERFDKLKAALETAKEKGDKKGEEQLKKLVGGAKSRYNVDKNFYLNVHDLQGNIGILKLRYKAKQALDNLIQKLRDKGIDPLSPDKGRYFTFARTGTGRDTAFTVEVYYNEREVENVGTVKVDVVRTLSEDVIDRLATEAGELLKLFKKPTAEEIQQIVKESDLVTGVSPNIDAILGYDADEAPTESGDDGEDEVPAKEPETDYAAILTKAEADSETPPEDEAPAPATKPAPAKAESKPAPKEEKKAAPKAEAKKASPAASAPPQTTAEEIAGMSDDEFLKSIGVN